MKKSLPVVTGVLGLVLGAWGSAVVMSSRHNQAPPPPEPAAVAQVVVDDRCPREQALDGRVATLERQLKEAQDARRSAETRLQAVAPSPSPAPPAPAPVPPSEDSLPLPFPANAPPAFTPKGFQALVERSIQECGLKMKLEAMDCSEYPCIAWTDSQQERINMAECAPWAEAFGHKTSVVVQNVIGADGGTRALVGLMAVPEDPTERRVAFRRSRERTSSLLQTYVQP